MLEVPPHFFRLADLTVSPNSTRDLTGSSTRSACSSPLGGINLNVPRPRA
jgi:hypothetical protein